MSQVRKQPSNPPTCADLVEFNGSLTLICQGCRNRAVFTALQAVLKFGEEATEADIVRRLRCEKCGKHGEADRFWFRAALGFPMSVFRTEQEIADAEAAARFSAEQRSQFADKAAPTPKRRRRR